MTGVYKDERLFTKIDAVEQRGTPVRHVHCVKTRLEQLVFEQDPYPSGERLIGLVERLTKPVLPSPDIVLAGIVGAIGKPKTECRRACQTSDLRTLKEVIGRLPTHLRSGLQTLPSRYSASWNTFGLIAPICRPRPAACLAR